MELLSSWLQNGVSYIVPMIVLLGLLIFVHELGHFLVAKFFKVKVETFSLGFGPKIFQFKRGDTVYCVSAFPLGGYVKMFGDDPTLDIPPEQRSQSFLHKPVGQRIWIVLAGPLMNLFFAVVLFAGVALLGEPTHKPIVGDVETSSQAHRIGFRSGDQILEVNGQKIERWDEFGKLLENSANQTLQVVVQRRHTDETITLSVTPKLVENKNILSLKDQVGWVDGLRGSSEPSLIGVSDPQSPAALAGLKTGDWITGINGQEIKTWRELSHTLLGLDAGATAELTVKRGSTMHESPSEAPRASDETVQIALTMPGLEARAARPVIAGDLPENMVTEAEDAPTSRDLMASLGLLNSETFIEEVSEDSPAAKAGLKAGDRIIEINSQPVDEFEDILKTVGEYESTEPPLKVVFLRDGETQESEIMPILSQPDKARGNYDSRYIIGVRPLHRVTPPESFLWKVSNPVIVVKEGFVRSWEWTKLTLISFFKLITNEVSPKNLGGVLSIGQMAQQSWEVGISSFFRIMAIISINLFIINLFPVPVLDGGHLMFFTIEALRGAPLSMRKMEIAQQIGLVLLLGLMGFALFNDFSRIFGL